MGLVCIYKLVAAIMTADALASSIDAVFWTDLVTAIKVNAPPRLLVIAWVRLYGFEAFFQKEFHCVWWIHRFSCAILASTLTSLYCVVRRTNHPSALEMSCFPRLYVALIRF